jgi:hypothetical protein
MFQRDYILRMIDAAAQAIAKAMKLLIAQKKPNEAEQEVAAGYAALSIDREMLLVLDAQTLKTQLGDDDKLTMAIRLLLCDCEIQCHKPARRAAARRLKAAQRLLAEHGKAPAELHDELARTAAMVESLTSA